MNAKIYKLNEFINYSSLSEDEMLEMANATSKVTGIKDIVLWMGPQPPQHGYRIKVSNIPNKINSDNLFTITIPNLEIIGDVNEKFINSKKIKQIKKFVKLNQNLIIKYSDKKMETLDFLTQLKKI